VNQTQLDQRVRVLRPELQRSFQGALRALVMAGPGGGAAEVVQHRELGGALGEDAMKGLLGPVVGAEARPGQADVEQQARIGGGLLLKRLEQLPRLPDLAGPVRRLSPEQADCGARVVDSRQMLEGLGALAPLHRQPRQLQVRVGVPRLDRK